MLLSYCGEAAIDGVETAIATARTIGRLAALAACLQRGRQPRRPLISVSLDPWTIHRKIFEDKLAAFTALERTITTAANNLPIWRR